MLTISIGETIKIEVGEDQVVDARIVATYEAGAADEESLSIGATLILFVFIGLAAANTLIITRSRGREFRLLRRIGITTGQLLGTLTVEGLIVGLTAVCVGAIGAFPALFVISWSMLGTVSIRVAPIVLLTFVAVVVGLSLGSVVLGTFRTDHGKLAGAIG